MNESKNEVLTIDDCITGVRRCSFLMGFSFVFTIVSFIFTVMTENNGFLTGFWAIILIVSVTIFWISRSCEDYYRKILEDVFEDL